MRQETLRHTPTRRSSHKRVCKIIGEDIFRKQFSRQCRGLLNATGAHAHTIEHAEPSLENSLFASQLHLPTSQKKAKNVLFLTRDAVSNIFIYVELISLRMSLIFLFLSFFGGGGIFMLILSPTTESSIKAYRHVVVLAVLVLA